MTMTTMNSASAMVRSFWTQAVRTARLAIGVPDYETYVRHLRTHHPERDVPTYEQFFIQCQNARYRNGGTRGCC